MIGVLGKLSIPIREGGTGEIDFLAGRRAAMFPARAATMGRPSRKAPK